jgi:eukaryotic-like serine/threonine-protein kinase
MTATRIAQSEVEAGERHPGPGRRDLIGSRLGVYRVLGRLGSGGMGDVYEVLHEPLGRRFALKLLRADLAADAETLARFHREPRAVAKLVSEHVVSIVDCGELGDGTPYFVMERLYGSDLRRLLTEQGTLPIARAVHLAIDACRGLDCAHRQGLIHRDLKPENLFVTTRDDGQDLCKLLDFGVVKSAHDNSTRPGAIIGTTRYMAPEQLGGDLPLTPRSDLFSLGVILYECLAGKSPFDGDTVERVLFKIMTERETPIRQLRPEVPAELEALLHAVLAKAPEERPASALAFAKALATFVRPGDRAPTFSTWQLQIADPEVATSSTRELTPRLVDADRVTPHTTTRQIRRTRRLEPSLLIAVALGLGLGIAVALLMVRRPPDVPSVSTRVEPQPPPTSTAGPTLMPGSSAAAPTAAISVSAVASAAASVGAAEAQLKPTGAKRKPSAPMRTVPSAAAVSYDPQNPYAE